MITIGPLEVIVPFFVLVEPSDKVLVVPGVKYILTNCVVDNEKAAPLGLVSVTLFKTKFTGVSVVMASVPFDDEPKILYSKLDIPVAAVTATTPPIAVIVNPEEE